MVLRYLRNDILGQYHCAWNWIEMKTREQHLKKYLLQKKLESSIEILGVAKYAKIVLENKDKPLLNVIYDVFKAASKLDERVRVECKSYVDCFNGEYNIDYLYDGFYEVRAFDNDELHLDFIVYEDELQQVISGLTPMDK